MLYDYLEKDHLGNTHAVLTDEYQVDIYPAATVENTNTAALNVEKSYYNILDANIIDESLVTGFTAAANSNYNNNNGNPPANNNPSANTGAPSAKLYQLDGTAGPQTGLGITLHVMTGDVIDIYGKSYYFSNNTGGTNNNLAITDILTGLLGSPAGGAAGKGFTVPNLNVPSGTVIPSSFLNRTPAAGDQTPNAYVNYILFDEQMRYVGGGFSKVNAATTGAQSVKDHHSELSGISVPKNGYLYVYVSNQSPVKVFFDNLQVVHTRGPLTEETHYYPFGLAMSGISSQAAGKLENLHKFNKGSELQHKEFSDGSGLEWYGTECRGLDPQIGRWLQTDFLSVKAPDESPYSFVQNNPLKFVDPLGLDTVRVDGPGEHKIKIGQGDILALTVNGATGYYTYDPNNKDAQNGFVSNGMSSAENEASPNVTVKAPKNTNADDIATNGLNTLGNLLGLKALAVNLMLEGGFYKNAAGIYREYTTLAKYKPLMSLEQQENLSRAFSEYRALGKTLTWSSRGVGALLLAWDLSHRKPTYVIEQDAMFIGMAEVPVVGAPMAAFLYANSFIPLKVDNFPNPGRTLDNWSSWAK